VISPWPRDGRFQLTDSPIGVVPLEWVVVVARGSSVLRVAIRPLLMRMRRNWGISDDVGFNALEMGWDDLILHRHNQ